jgi:hypothetical protein
VLASNLGFFFRLANPLEELYILQLGVTTAIMLLQKKKGIFPCKGQKTN